MLQFALGSFSPPIGTCASVAPASTCITGGIVVAGIMVVVGVMLGIIVVTGVIAVVSGGRSGTAQPPAVGSAPPWTNADNVANSVSSIRAFGGGGIVRTGLRTSIIAICPTVDPRVAPRSRPRAANEPARRLAASCRGT